ncbi:hypothetical protein GH741_19990 [Aquibacillus halophilus]|uniref:RsgI N-terminal anti-sigma domain-containing protein n=1 Tax=Aquibacillus halophilus TaxID=930132 RepID=A0A6A8DGW0_9BACI|nr:hypothetical protein [Aquibacillus halophilus]MRH44928.1 hypothetical protein [Aquibacillus halophilus]
MKKGIVVQQRRTHTVVLDRDGGFYKVNPLEQANIGDEVDYQVKKEMVFSQLFFAQEKIKSKFKIAAMAALLVLASLPLYAWYDDQKVYAFVSIDFNPSLELEVNEEMVVKNVHAFNKDAETLLGRIGTLEGQSLEDVTGAILTNSRQQGILGDLNTILVGVSYMDVHKADKVTKILDNIFERKLNSELQIATFVVPKEIREEAKHKKTSMNQEMAASIKENGTFTSNQTNMNRNEQDMIQSFFENKANKESKTKRKESENTSKNPKIQKNEKNKINEHNKKDINEKINQVMKNRANDKIPPGLEKKLSNNKKPNNIDKR